MTKNIVTGATAMSVRTDPSIPTPGADLAVLRTLLAWIAAIGLCVTVAIGITAVLGTPLGVTAARFLATGLTCGLAGFFAVGAVTLYQRSPALHLPALIGVVCSVGYAAILIVADWGGDVGETAARAAAVLALLSFALGLTGFLSSQQRAEDPRGIRGLMVATLLATWTLSVALAVDVIFATSASPIAPAAGVQFPLSGLTFQRFLGVTSLLALLGLLLLPILRRAHPAYRGGASPQR